MEGIQLTLFGKTSQERSLHIMGETFKKCSGKSQKPTFQCLNLDDEQAPEWFEAAKSAPRGGCLTLNFGECPSEESVSILSEVLETTAPEKYCLSATACAGILRRAERRGKELPPILKNALETVVCASTQEETAVG